MEDANQRLDPLCFDRPNIRYHVRVKNGDKHQLLDFIRSEHPEGSGIVYARTRKRTESIAEWLSQQGVDALPYHAGLPPEVRMGNQKRFQENSTRVIVATVAFGKGKADGHRSSDKRMSPMGKAARPDRISGWQEISQFCSGADL